MKVEINNKEENTEIKFPCLMISDDKSTIILATSFKRKTAINGLSLKHPDGEIEKDIWAGEFFKPFNGSITLSNE